MKKFIKKIINFLFQIPINSKLINFLENFLLNYKGQGKGWGEGSIKNEVNACLSLMKYKPLIFVDIGANKGEYTKFMIKKCPDLECHLFEPSNLNFEILTKAFYKFSGRVFINKKALSKENSNSTLYADSSGSGLASLTKRRLDHFNMQMNIEEQIQILRFEDYWKKKDCLIDYVKIDVEGHELDVLKGFGKIIHNVKLVQFEFGGCNIDTRTYFQDFWYFFKEKKFKIYRITPRGLTPIKKYSENIESFLTTNYVAFNENIQA